MNQTELKRLLKKYLDGNCSEEEIEKINFWFDTISDPSLNLTESEKEELKLKIRSKLPFHVITTCKNKPTPVFSFMMRLGVAASIAVIAVASWFIYTNKSLLVRSSDKLDILSNSTIIENSHNVEELVFLPDSSRVLLSPGSKITFQKNFKLDLREVHLIGEAFFDVVKDASRPFYVYSNNVTTKVLGTSFTIKALNENHVVEVEVKTGCVTVYSNAKTDALKKDTLNITPNKGVILMPNQKVVYFIKEDHWVTSIVDEPTPLRDVASQELVFDNTSMNDIVKRLEAQYGIEIIYENTQIAKCTFTGDVSSLSLFDILNVIGKSISAEYEVRGSKILLTGKGCS